MLKTRLRYISPSGGTEAEEGPLTTVTAFQRAVTVSSILFKPAQHQPPFKTTFHDGHFILTNHVDTPVGLALHKFCEAAHLSTINFQSALEAVLPVGLPIHKIPVHHLKDNFSSVSIHNQPQNVVFLQPLISRYWSELLTQPSGCQTLYDKGGVVRIKVDQWLQLYHNCFSLAAAAMILNSGAIDPFAFKHYCYDGPGRNIFILKNGLLAFINPVSSHRVTDSHLDIAVMPADITRLLLILICILLPIASQLRTLKGQFIPFQSSHLWVLPRRQTTGDNKWRYTSNHVNAYLKELTFEIFGVALDGELIRKLIYQVFSHDFPLLFSGGMHLRSPVDDTAQHLWATGIYNYGRLSQFPAHPNLIGDRAARHIVCSEMWQALTSTGPIHESWRLMVEGTLLFPGTRFPEDAFYVARRLVLTLYGIQDERLPANREKMIEGLLSTKPFLQGITVGIQIELLH